MKISDVNQKSENTKLLGHLISFSIVLWLVCYEIGWLQSLLMARLVYSDDKFSKCYVFIISILFLGYGHHSHAKSSERVKKEESSKKKT